VICYIGLYKINWISLNSSLLRCIRFHFNKCINDQSSYRRAFPLPRLPCRAVAASAVLSHCYVSAILRTYTGHGVVSRNQRPDNKWICGLWTAALKPKVRHFGRRHLGFWNRKWHEMRSSMHPNTEEHFEVTKVLTMNDREPKHPLGDG